MKEITLKFIGTGYKDKYQLNIEIYDLNNNLIYEGTTYNGSINICIKTNNYYKINSTLFNSVIYVNCKKAIYIFILSRSYMNNITTFILLDYNYNLPIEKGEILLWKK